MQITAAMRESQHQYYPACIGSEAASTRLSAVGPRCAFGGVALSVTLLCCQWLWSALHVCMARLDAHVILCSQLRNVLL